MPRRTSPRAPQAPAAGLTATLITTALVFAPAGAALARDFPQKPVRIIVPSAPGGGYDYIARALAEKMPATLGQPIVVENRPGAGALVGTRAAVAAPPDGYTLVVGGLANLAFSVGVYPKPGYDPIADFTPVALVGSFSYTLVARRDAPQSTLAETIAHARANPKRITVGTAGAGSGQHIAAALLAQRAGLDLVIVHYKGAQPVYPDLLAGRVDLFFDNTTTARPFIESQRVKPLAVSSSRRDPLLPAVPTVAETGLAGYAVDSWIGIFAPAKTPDEAIVTLRTAVEASLKDAAFRAQLQANGWDLNVVPPAETRAFVKAEVDRWVRFIRDAGITAE